MGDMTDATTDLEIANELIQQYANENAELAFNLRLANARLKRAEARIEELTAPKVEEEPDES